MSGYQEKIIRHAERHNLNRHEQASEPDRLEWSDHEFKHAKGSNEHTAYRNRWMMSTKM